MSYIPTLPIPAQLPLLMGTGLPVCDLGHGLCVPLDIFLVSSVALCPPYIKAQALKAPLVHFLSAVTPGAMPCVGNSNNNTSFLSLAGLSTT